MTVGIESRPEFLHRNDEGSIDVIVGPMFSSKSDRLIWILRQAKYAGYNVQAFKPTIDRRRGSNTINTFDKVKYPAISVDSSSQIFEKLEKGVQVVGIDEGNFFDMGLTKVCKELAGRGIHLIVAGLHSDFRGETFGPMGELLVEADYIEKRQARCAICGKPASRTQRLITDENGIRPAFYEDPIVVVGEEQYQARCRHHHEVPHREIRS
jgi:thymidine kinase